MKLGVLAVIIAAVFFGYRIIERRFKGANTPPAPTAASVDDAQAMARCATCQTYVPAQGARGCDRADCPYPT